MTVSDLDAALVPPDSERLDEYAERIVRDAPPFTAQQRARIAAILQCALDQQCRPDGEGDAMDRAS